MYSIHFIQIKFLQTKRKTSKTEIPILIDLDFQLRTSVNTQKMQGKQKYNMKSYIKYKKKLGNMTNYYESNFKWLSNSGYWHMKKTKDWQFYFCLSYLISMIFYFVQAVQAVLHVYILFLPILYSLQNNKSLLIIKFMVTV